MPEIRELTKKYAKEFAAIEKLCFTDYWSEESFRSCFSSQYIKVIGALDEGKLIGYAITQSIEGEGEILNLCVLPEYRRQGTAKAMLEASGVFENDRVFLEVRAGNEPAKALYKALGFRKIAVREKYYLPEKEDAVVMVREKQ